MTTIFLAENLDEEEEVNEEREEILDPNLDEEKEEREEVNAINASNIHRRFLVTDYFS